MKPSRTYTLGVAAMLAELLIAVIGLIVAVAAPEQLPDLAELLSTCALCIAGAAGVSAGGMSLRDSASGGLTSSQGDQVLQSSTHAISP